MEVAVLMEKFCDLDVNIGTTSAYFNIIGSLKSAGVKHRIYHYDEYLFINKKPIDEFLISELKNNHQDFLFVSYYPVKDDPRNIKIETLLKIKEKIPVVLIWFDFGHDHISRLANEISYATTLNIIVDVYRHQPKFIPMWVPQDENIFTFSNNKTIDICFVGSMYEDRARYLNYLKDKVNLFVSGGQRLRRLTMEQYAEVLKNSKVSINFPSKPDGTIQAKSRIYETMLCGALLAEKNNDAISKWFGEDCYVSFTSENDALDKINYYLKNDEERNKIVNAAHAKMKTSYNSSCWWDTVWENVRNCR